MNILQVSKYYHPFRGGIELVVQDLSEGLQGEGHNVTVLCYSHGPEASSEEVINGVFVKRCSTFTTIASQPLSFSYLFYLITLAFKADIIHVHSPNPLAELCCLLFAWKKKIIVTHHSDIVRQKILKYFYKPIYNFFLKFTKAVVVPTDNHINYSNQIKKYSQKCHVIPFSLRPHHSQELTSKAELEKEIELEYDPFFLFVGRLVTYKGISYLIEAMKHVNTKLVIVGEGPLRTELLKQAFQLGLRSKIFFLGQVDNNTLDALYKTCMALVLPSISSNENFGMVQLEAMYHKKPVITTKLDSGVSAVGIDGKTCLQVPIKDSQAIAIAMNKLLENPKLREEMGNEAKKLFDQKYTYNQMISSHLDLYKKKSVS